MKIKNILILLILLPLFLFGESAIPQRELKKATPSVKDNFSTTLETRDLINNAFYNGSFTQGFATRFTGKSLCGDMFIKKEFNDGAIEEEVINDLTIALLSFNSDDGSYSCLYKSQSKAIEQIRNFRLNGYTDWLARFRFVTSSYDGSEERPQYDDRIDALELFNGDFKPHGVETYVSSDKDALEGGRYDIFQDATKRGLWTPDSSKEFNLGNITMSQFLIGLVTLSSSFVEGVDAYGNILIKESVSRNMAVLDKRTSQGAGEGALDYIQAGWNLLKQFLTNSDDVDNNYKALIEDYDVFSYEDYFDKKVFGMYYTFMGIAWGNVFSYGALLYLSMILAYSSGVIAIKYGMHRLEAPTSGSEEGRPFDFPIKNRLVTIGATLALSFIHFPTGQGVNFTNENGVSEKISAQTSVAKSMISYMGNIGTHVADISASNTMVVYLSYLLKTQNIHNIETIDEMLSDYRFELVKLRLDTVFYQDHCVKPYKTRIDKLGGFSSVPSGSVRLEGWSSEISESWRANFASTIFKKNNNINNVVSLRMCQEQELGIAVTRDLLQQYKVSLASSFEKLGIIEGVWDTITSPVVSVDKMSEIELFVMTQLGATSTLGWFNIASMPLLHVYLSSVGILELGKDRPEIETMGQSGQTRAILSNESKGKDDETIEELTDGDIFGFESQGKGLITSMMSLQVYFMLPAFNETRQGVEKLIDGSLDVVLQIIPIGKVLAKAKGMLKKIGKGNGKTDNKGLYAMIIFVISFFVTIYIYQILLKAIFATIITLMVVIKIVFYILDVFQYFFVSPLIVAYQMTINPQTDRLNKFVVDGFVILAIKPTLIVFSMMMFIIGFEVMSSIYSLIFNVVFSSVQLADKFFHGTVNPTSMIIVSNIKGFGEVMVQILGMLLAYKLIFDGDKMILSRFGYKDDGDTGMSKDMSDKTQALFGGRI